MKILLEDKFIIINVYFNRDKFNKNTKLDKVNKFINGRCGYNLETRVIDIGIFDNRLSTVTHELYHTMEFIIVMIAETNDRDVHFSESNAYLFGYLFKKIAEGGKKWQY